MSAPLSYETILDRFLDWAEGREDIQAVLLLGSRAREDRPADAWSDLDLLVFATNPDRYLRDVEWVECLGDPWLTFVEPMPRSPGQERRVLFAGGLDVDFAFITPEVAAEMAAALDEGELPADVAEVFRRGIRVLLDRKGDLEAFVERASRAVSLSWKPPDERTYRETVHDFLYHAVWTTKKLRRGELWTAKFSLDGYMKALPLRRMVEWHARVVQGADTDTWFQGRFLEEWADPRIVAGLRRAFARYETQDMVAALRRNLDLFRWVAREVGEGLGYDYPEEAEERTRGWLEAHWAPLETRS